MEGKLINFMIAMGEDRSVQSAYAADADVTMRTHGLSDREIGAVRSGDESAVFRAMGVTENSTVSKLVFVPIVPPMKKAA